MLQSTTLPRKVTTFEEFARVDIYTGDIDPVYFAIDRLRQDMGEGMASRFCVAMLCFYHTGTAARACEFKDPEEFWGYVWNQYDTAPRASERRHWRGMQGKNSLLSMQAWERDPSRWFEGFGNSYSSVKRICETRLKGFGAYFQLKICDYLDRCLGVPFDQNYLGLENNLPTLPAQAAELLYPGMKAPQAFLKACERLKPLGLLAPPKFDRLIGPAEVETVLCDWKRGKYGNHLVGDDVKDKRDSLRGYGYIAERIIDYFPQEFPLNTFQLALE